ncbi:Hypothetical protein CINCED_3A007975 [Cinara cedri]|uniref:Uncharacterized protein n=1 Tax=Cinara cedri TaxID=506608 RepID=A0A5E4NSQ7_9HEMI|nr:Hypothetical protein CINCED_3A007975 [Cinara cedri]
MTNDEDQKRLVTDNETLKQKYKVLQHECQVNQQEIVGRKRIRVTKFRSQLKLQAEFISKLGFMFAYYLFKVTQNQEFIDKMMYRQDDLEKLSRTMIGVLTTFDDAYGYSNTPIVDTYETRFILGIVGVVANLSTTEKGRRYYSTMNSGKTIMCIILKIVHRLPSPSGNSLKK